MSDIDRAALDAEYREVGESLCGLLRPEIVDTVELDRCFASVSFGMDEELETHDRTPQSIAIALRKLLEQVDGS